jgi:LPS-assembly protein
MTTAHAKLPGQGAAHKHAQKNPATEWLLCHGDAVPLLPGIAPTGKKGDRLTSPADIQSDSADLSKVDLSVFNGNVEMRRADQWMFADTLSYRHSQDTWQAIGAIKYQDSTVRVNADRAEGDAGKNITTIDTVTHPIVYQLRNVRGNGKSSHGEVVGDQETFTDATYSTCDPDDRKWEIHGDRIEMNGETNVGTAHDATVRIGNVPVLYMPYLSFPLDNQRKSGFLIPNIGFSSHNGFLFAQPYYFNLAPNYDATLTARLFGYRGLMLDGEFRYLTQSSHGTVDATWLPDDRVAGSDRGSLAISSATTFSPHWYSTLTVNRVSDANFLGDFSNQGYGSTISFLESQGGIYGRGRYWNAGAFLQTWQIAEPLLGKSSEPFQRLPDLYFRWKQPFANHLELGLKSEATRFVQPVRNGGSRLDLYPYLSLPFEHAAWYVRPEVGYRYTTYNLDAPVKPGGDASPTRGVPILDLDAGAYFDRDTSLFGHAFVNTLEPRLFYLRVPYRDQSAIPVFDSQPFTFSFDQLFRTNSFTGADRQSDANQLTAAVTTRLLDAQNGREWFNASAGQIHYFNPPQVRLPSAPFANLSGSDYVLDANLNLDDHWTVNGSYLYDADHNRTDLGSVRLQYQFGLNGVVNAAYRYRPGLVQQADISFSYPLNDRWRLLGRWDYSLLKPRATVEALAGVEWGDCCMAVRVLARDYIRDVAGDKGRAFFIEIELKGLGSFGKDTEQLLDRDILGYSR